jgi:hypothetical protein
MRGTKGLVLAAVAAVLGGDSSPTASAAPINPMAFKVKFDEAKRRAELVGEVRVLATVCSRAKDDQVTLQLCLQLTSVEQGKLKKNDVVVVTHEVPLPAGPGPRAYGYMAAQHQFPFTPGATGSVALNWDKDKRAYAVVAGWVPEPNGEEIPKEVGKAVMAPNTAT